MNPQEIVNTLTNWKTLLSSFNEVRLDFSEEQGVIDTRLKERQQIIDSLQHLDAELTEIRMLKASGWLDIDAQTVKKIESLIEKGNEISSSCIAKDQKNLDIVTKSRAAISGKIGNVRKSKGYLTSSHVAKQRPSIIVDSHA